MLFNRKTEIIRRYLQSMLEMRTLLKEIRGFLHFAYYEQTKRNLEEQSLSRYGYKVFSQTDEDGIVQEIFKRIGIESKTFFEFGVGDGVENNTLNLLLHGWKGVWVQAQGLNKDALRSYTQLNLIETFVTPENINDLFSKCGLPQEIDFLSIDIDGNDYWVWESVAFNPRVVCIEYNSTLRPPLSIVTPYREQNWDGTNYFGASLTALQKLGFSKGYSLVGCNFTGVNAFFVRNDLVGNKFLAPFTAETHYRPPCYLILQSGHQAGIGPYVNV